MVKGFVVTHHTVEGAVSFLSTRLYAGMDLSIALLSVGYIVGIRIASFIFKGVLGFGLLVLIRFDGWMARHRFIADGFWLIWHRKFATLVSVQWSLALYQGPCERPSSQDCRRPSSRPNSRTWFRGLNKIFPWTVFSWFVASWWFSRSSTGGHILVPTAGALFLAFVAFFSLLSQVTSLVLSGPQFPVSGMTIATLLFTVGLVYVVGDLIWEWPPPI